MEDFEEVTGGRKIEKTELWVTTRAMVGGTATGER